MGQGVSDDTTRMLLAKAPRGVTFTRETAKRMIGQRIRIAPGDPRTVATVVDAWLHDEEDAAARGKEIHADVRIDTDAPEPIKEALTAPVQASLEGWSE